MSFPLSMLGRRHGGFSIVSALKSQEHVSVCWDQVVKATNWLVTSFKSDNDDSALFTFIEITNKEQEQEERSQVKA